MSLLWHRTFISLLCTYNDLRYQLHRYGNTGLHPVLGDLSRRHGKLVA